MMSGMAEPSPGEGAAFDAAFYAASPGKASASPASPGAACAAPGAKAALSSFATSLAAGLYEPPAGLTVLRGFSGVSPSSSEASSCRLPASASGWNARSVAGSHAGGGLCGDKPECRRLYACIKVRPIISTSTAASAILRGPGRVRRPVCRSSVYKSWYAPSGACAGSYAYFSPPRGGRLCAPQRGHVSYRA